MNNLARKSSTVVVVAGLSLTLGCAGKSGKAIEQSVQGTVASAPLQEAPRDIFAWYDGYKKLFDKRDPKPILATWHPSYSSVEPDRGIRATQRLDRDGAEQFLREEIALAPGSSYYVESILVEGVETRIKGFIGGALVGLNSEGKKVGMSFFGRFEDTWKKSDKGWLLSRHEYTSGGWDPFVKGDNDRVKAVHEATRKKLGL